MPGIPKDTDLSLLSPPLVAGADGSLESRPGRRDGSRNTILWPAEFDGTIIASDSFEGGLHQYDVNDVNFQWAGGENSSLLSIVEQDNQGPLIVYEGASRDLANKRPENMSKDWTALTGRRSLMFPYPANVNSVEYKWSIDPPGFKALWLGFDMRVPVNYYHQSRPMSSGENQKLFRLYMKKYSDPDPGAGTKVGLSCRPDGASGSSYWFVKNFNEYTSGSDQTGPERSRFITVPNDRGRWMRICFRVQCSSVPGVSDGSIEVWRRWENEATFTKEFNFIGQHIPERVIPDGVKGFSKCTFMGYQNSPYEDDTEFLFDNYQLAEAE